MLPGLHPGLLLASEEEKIEFIGLPDYIYISTSGGPGNRPVNLFITVEGGVAPYEYSWSVSAGEFTPSPSEGSGTSNNGYVGFSTQTYYGGLSVSELQLVGMAQLWVIAANGVQAGVNVEVYAGQ